MSEADKRMYSRLTASEVNIMLGSFLYTLYRVPDNENLFRGRLANLPRGDPLNETPRTYCLCDDGINKQCGRRAVSDTTADDNEPNEDVSLGSPIVGGRRRRKRQIDEALHTNDWRVYPTSYR